ncbi:carbohydrate ABC transporter permease [Actinomadura mexicana]|uniref:Carbohydrate ABC transporter membrane protein 1, CUT1 family n=1 Tax=Actinomadura mexicana TaxID=134959 RepID=A0A238XH53_9ACTN|nr:sugar ABC transporter permease [Actinomadura mexicana]SNR57249.1 carbohydrate ABC transporter membrane protein 1, CUT1 family [Actinomadura mexicana]
MRAIGVRTPAGRPTRRSGAAASWWFVVPALAVYGAGFLIPNLIGAGYAFTDWDGLTAPGWVGLENFRRVAGDSQGRDALVHSLLLAGVYVVAVNLVGLGLALGLHQTLKSRNVLRALFFAPAVVSPLAVAYIWQFVLQPDGPLNEGLRKVGLGALAHPWLGDPSTALWAVVAVLVWQFCGYQMAIYLAGLQSIPRELYEAAAVDGAGYWRQFWYITFHQLRPAMAVNISLALIGSLKVFDQILALTGGGPGASTETLGTQVYKQAFVNSRFGYSAALALVLVAAVSVLSLLQLRSMRDRES